MNFIKNNKKNQTDCKKNAVVLVRYTQSALSLQCYLSQRSKYARIIWFYLVRAEVVLWWRYLNFFCRKACIFNQKLL